MTENASKPNYAGGHRDGFVLRMSADGATAEYATFVGGSYTGDRDPDDTVEALRTDWRGHVYVTGETFSPDFPTPRSIQQTPGGAIESYLLKLAPESRQILYSRSGASRKAMSVRPSRSAPGRTLRLWARRHPTICRFK